MLAKQGEWDQCLQLAAKSGQDTLIRYLFAYVKKMASEGNIGTAVNTLTDYNSPAISSQYKVYKQLVIEVLQEADSSELNACKNMLKKLITNVKSQHENNDPVVEEFETQ